LPLGFRIFEVYERFSGGGERHTGAGHLNRKIHKRNDWFDDVLRFEGREKLREGRKIGRVYVGIPGVHVFKETRESRAEYQ
jgi:hypothetical protein